MRAPATFDSVVLAAVVRDLRPLVGARVRGVHQAGAAEIALELRREGAAGKRPAILLLSAHARWARVHLIPSLSRGDAGPFAQQLRARLTGARLEAVRQPAFERSLTLRFETDAGGSELVAEVMGRHSNLILVHDGVIAGALKLIDRTQSSVREVLPGRPFSPPPRDRPPPSELDAVRLATLLAGRDAPLAQALTASVLGLGPATARELCARAGMDPDAPAAGVQDIHAVHQALQDIERIVREEVFRPILYLAEGHPAGFAPFQFQHLAALPQRPVPTMSEAVDAVAGWASVRADVDEQRRAVRSAIQAALRKVERAADEIARTLAEADQAAQLRIRGELLLAYAAQIPTGSAEALLPGFDGAMVRVPMDPVLTPVQNARKLFARYAKLREARPQLDARLAALRDERQYLASALAMAEAADSLDDLAALREDLVAEGYLSARRGARRPAAWQPRTFALPGGAQILVGRSNHENDRLTFKAAGPDDLWFHARGVPGAHVILRTGGRDPALSEIEAAAAAAAFFSAARDAGRVAVDYTLRKHVRKPRGSRPGMVTYERETTVDVAPRAPQP